MKELRMIIAGGRDFNDYDLLEYNVNEILKISFMQMIKKKMKRSY